MRASAGSPGRASPRTRSAQVLPTSLGGDATRIFSATRRHRNAASAVTGSVLLERVLGGFATLLLGAVGFVLAVGRYDVGAYLWIEAAILVVSVAGGSSSSRGERADRSRAPSAPRVARLERPLRAAYEGLHGYRDHRRLVGCHSHSRRSSRCSACWPSGSSRERSASTSRRGRSSCSARSSFSSCWCRSPSTGSRSARRSSSASSGTLHVPADPAFATGFLFYLLSVASAIPGAILLLTRRALPPRRKDKRVEIRT